MKKFEAKKQIKSRIYSRTTLIILLFVIILLVKGVFTLYLRNKESVEVRDGAQARLRDLERRRESLSLEIEKLNKNEGIEEEIREKFNVAKPGEKVVIIVPEEEVATTAPKQGFFSNLWHKIW
jgi:cell division protein FtsB